MKKTKTWKIVLLCILCVVIYLLPITGIVFVSYVEEKGKTFEIKDNIIEISKGKMIIEGEDAFYDEKEETYYITGYLKNTTKKEYDNVSVSYRLYDVDSNILGEATSYLETLGSKKTWKFKAIYSDIDASEVSTFEFLGVDYY